MSPAGLAGWAGSAREDGWHDHMLPQPCFSALTAFNDNSGNLVPKREWKGMAGWDAFEEVAEVGVAHSATNNLNQSLSWRRYLGAPAELHGLVGLSHDPRRYVHEGLQIGKTLPIYLYTDN